MRQLLQITVLFTACIIASIPQSFAQLQVPYQIVGNTNVQMIMNDSTTFAKFQNFLIKGYNVHALYEDSFNEFSMNFSQPRVICNSVDVMTLGDDAFMSAVIVNPLRTTRNGKVLSYAIIEVYGPTRQHTIGYELTRNEFKRYLRDEGITPFSY